MKNILSLCLLLVISFQSFSQDKEITFMPEVGLGVGMMNLIGDIGYKRFNQPITAKKGLQLDVRFLSSGPFAVNAFIMTGKVSGEKRSPGRNVNYLSSVLSEGLMFSYRFMSRTNSAQVIVPYVSAGVEFLSYTTKADLKDANNNFYYYWNDGSIRNLPESDPNASQSVVLYRDYRYETDVKDLSTVDSKKLSPSSFAFPVGAGFRFRISQRTSLNFGVTCHFIQSDNIDGVSPENVLPRNGDKAKDKLLFSAVSFHYDFAAPRETHRKGGNKDIYKNVDFVALEKEDSDGDGVPDVNDDSSATPESIPVDSRGRPLDKDGDGIPDYRDDEQDSQAGALVNENGVTITEEMIEEQFRKDSLAALPAIREYVKSFDRLTEKSQTARPAGTSTPPDLIEERKKMTFIPPKYQSLDKNLDGIIAPNEISKEIDLFIEGKSTYSVSEFYELVDFFFKQN